MFQERAQERQQVVDKLRARVVELGGTPEEEGGLLAKADRQVPVDSRAPSPAATTKR